MIDKSFYINSNTLNLFPTPALALNTHMGTTFKDQSYVYFIKRKYGLYKSVKFENKRIKNKFVQLVNRLKYNKLTTNTNFLFKKKPKIIFTKYLNKLFIRGGRTLLRGYICQKKTIIQRFFTKKITSFLKGRQTLIQPSLTTNLLLIRCNICYTYTDAVKFIHTYGISLNTYFTYDPQFKINPNTFFSFIFSSNLYHYLNTNRVKFIFMFKNIKFYKFRVKTLIFKKHYKYSPMIPFYKNYINLYLNKDSDIEFDFKSMNGLYLYVTPSNLITHHIKTLDRSLYMHRSYNWKYLT